MIAISELSIAPVKSTALTHPASVHVAERGIVEDRRFLVLTAAGKMATGREIGALALVRADYKADPEHLTVSLPDGRSVEGPIELGEPVAGTVFRRPVTGRLLRGEWDALLSDFCGQPLRLFRSDQPGACVDIHPLSLLSEASVQALNRHGAQYGTFDSARFRMNLLLSGCTPHQEDEWVGKRLRVGADLVVRVVARDSRCAQTTLNPRTGKRDADTLRAIISYRPDDKAYFGVHAVVEQPGVIHVGDAVQPL